MRLLHLSDIHFGADKHSFKRRDKTDPTALAKILASHPYDPRPSLVVISGDIGWSGDTQDYKDALIFCRELRDRINAPILLVPGNHDVDRTSGIDDEKRQDNFIHFIECFYDSELSSFFPFINDTGSGLRPRDRLISVYRKDDEESIVIGVNSAARINGWEHCHKCGRRVPTTEAVACAGCGLNSPIDTSRSTSVITNAVAQQVTTYCDSLPNAFRWLRAFVLHHNMFPFDEPDEHGHIIVDQPRTPADPSMIANSAALQDWLARTGFHLVLHGHKHQPNGRQDTLFRRDDPPGGRRIVVLGAGSTGVVPSDRGSEPLGFFLISTNRLSNKRFQIHAKPMKVSPTTLLPYVTGDFDGFTCEIGPAMPAPPPLFYAERLVDCHNAISHAFKGQTVVLRNFCSIVDVKDPVEFEFPPTTLRAGVQVDSRLIEASFRALHPEYNPETESWGESEDVHKRLLSLRPRFLFQHGPRMFGITGSHTSAADDHTGHKSPMHHAIQELASRPSTSRAFVSIFNPTIDVPGRIEPPPALAGVQFHVDKTERRLDLTFTFRKIDLSFWWVVNMYEAIKLWRWASSKIERECHCTTGRITFFATLAEWKDEDTATFLIDLDQLPLEDIVELALSADIGNGILLVEKLRDKRERTNVNNIDPHGIERLTDIVGGIARSRPPAEGRWSEELMKRLCEARDFLRSAETNARKRNENAAKVDLRKAADTIKVIETALLKNS